MIQTQILKTNTAIYAGLFFCSVCCHHAILRFIGFVADMKHVKCSVLITITHILKSASHSVGGHWNGSCDSLGRAICHVVAISLWGRYLIVPAWFHFRCHWWWYSWNDWLYRAFRLVTQLKGWDSNLLGYAFIPILLFRHVSPGITIACFLSSGYVALYTIFVTTMSSVHQW